jgi:DNA-directed RNA polymerase specialized sigma subunit
VAYPLQSAVFQWERGAQRLREADTREANRRVNGVIDELRRRLGSTFTAEELAQHYGEGTGWADELSGMESWIVDAAFHRYLREARNYAGGRAPVEPDPSAR